MRRLALRSALAVKAQEGRVTVLESFELEEPKTRALVDLLRGIGVEDSALVVLAAPNLVVAKSVANLPWAKAILARNLNLYDLFTHNRLVITRDALEAVEETLGAGAGGSAEAALPSKPAAKAETRSPEGREEKPARRPRASASRKARDEQ
jgi:large subunit ribosomal protein L4